MLKLTCIGLQVLWGHHDNKADRPFIPKHLVGPAADGAHAFDCCDTIVGDKHLEKRNQNTPSLSLIVSQHKSYGALNVHRNASCHFMKMKPPCLLNVVAEKAEGTF